jgi:hypothetical protein
VSDRADLEYAAGASGKDPQSKQFEPYPDRSGAGLSENGTATDLRKLGPAAASRSNQQSAACYRIGD